MSKLSPTEIVYSNLNNILSSIIHAKNFVSGMSLKEFLNDDKTIYAVARCLQMISLRAAFISRLTRKNRDVGNFNLPYRELNSLGRRLNHLYQQAHPEIIWQTIEKDLDDLEFQVRRALGNRVDDSLPEKIVKYPKIELFTADEGFELTSSTLSTEITPFIEALTDLQHVIDYTSQKPASVVHIQYIGQNSPVGIALDGVADALKVFIDQIVPWRREHAKQMAELDKKYRQAQIEVVQAEVLEKRANALKQREEAKQARLEAERMRIELALKIIQASPNQYTEAEKITLIKELSKPLGILTDSNLLVALPKNPRT